MFKLWSFPCWHSCQFLGGQSLRPKTQSFRPDSGLESDCDFLRPQNDPGAPETPAQTNFGHNGWILEDLFKGSFFPNGSIAFLANFPHHC
jgi:hypothetical protein